MDEKVSKRRSKASYSKADSALVSPKRPQRQQLGGEGIRSHAPSRHHGGRGAIG